MNRKETTIFLNKLLEKDKLTGASKYWAKEVTFNHLCDNPFRIDYVQFIPVNQYSIGGIEKGEFVCYEIKSCKEDYNSGHGLNFIAEKNYIVTSVSTYNELKKCGELNKLPHWIGIMIAVPVRNKYNIEKELVEPTELSNNCKWCFYTIKKASKRNRKRPMNEMLFCMLRSRCNSTE